MVPPEAVTEMNPEPELLAADNGDRHCAVQACHQPPCFRCVVVGRVVDACAGHLVDVIRELSERCPQPADVTVYAADRTAGARTRPAPAHGFAFTTIRVPE